MIKKLLLVVVVVGLLGSPKSAHAAGKVSLSPTPVNLTEGQSQVVTVTLDEPVIVEEGEPFVTLNIASTNPSRLTTSVTSVTWTGAQWNQSRTFTLTAVDDLLVNGDANDLIDITVESNSEYYNSYAPAFVANALDNDVNPVVLPAVLPEVGQGGSAPVALLAALTVGLAAYALQRRGKLKA